MKENEKPDSYHQACSFIRLILEVMLFRFSNIKIKQSKVVYR